MDVENKIAKTLKQVRDTGEKTGRLKYLNGSKTFRSKCKVFKAGLLDQG